MSKKERIFLLGPRGSGKTTVGRVLAENLGWNFLDADEYLEKTTGKTIAGIFAVEGEKCFRDLESKILTELAAMARVVIGTGGGVVLCENNRKVIQESGYAVWLKTSLANLVSRLLQDEKSGKKRPNLVEPASDNPLARLQQEALAVVPAREPFYRQCADFECPTDDIRPEETARMIQENFTRVAR